MCAAARSTPWPSSERAKLPVLDADDLGIEPTVRADFNFGQITLPVPPPRIAAPTPGSAVKAYPRSATPTPARALHPIADDTMPAPMIAPPPSAKLSLAIGFVIGTSAGLAVLGAAWHFFL